MQLHNLKPAEGSVQKVKRIGRGEGSGHGGTATRGNKGAQSNTGYSRKVGHEGGQMPLQRRLPKVGFKNFSRVEYTALNLGKIQAFVDKFGATDITVDSLREKGFVAKRALVKVLGTGELKSKVNVSVHSISEAAKGKIEGLGGSVTIVKK